MSIPEKLSEHTTVRCIMVGALQTLILFVLLVGASTYEANSATLIMPFHPNTALAVTALAWTLFSLTNALYHYWRKVTWDQTERGHVTATIKAEVEADCGARLSVALRRCQELEDHLNALRSAANGKQSPPEASS